MRRLTIRQTAESLGVSTQTVWRQIESGELSYSKENGHIYVHVAKPQESKIESSESEKLFEKKRGKKRRKTKDRVEEASLKDFLLKQIEVKDKDIKRLNRELNRTRKRLEDALSENTRLAQGVHMEAQKLVEMMLPYSPLQLESKEKNKKSKKRKKR